MSFMISLCVVLVWNSGSNDECHLIFQSNVHVNWRNNAHFFDVSNVFALSCLVYCTVLYGLLVCEDMIHVCVCSPTMTVPFNNIWLSDPSFRSGHNPMGQSAHTHPKVSIKTNNNIRSIAWDMHRIKAIRFLLELFLSVCMHCPCSSEILRNCRTFSPFISSLISVCVLLQAASNAVHYAIINGFFGLAEKREW